MATTLADRLKEQRRKHFVGRTDEKTLFRNALESHDLPFLLFYGYGPGGVGKTSLVHEFVGIAEELGIATYIVDARFVPPNPESCEWALMQVTGTATPADARKILAAKRAVLFIDTFELLHTLEGWFREEFLPSMPDTLLTVVMGRRRPSNAWMSDSAWRSLAKIVGLRNLSEDESRKYLAFQDVAPDRFSDLLKFTHGHPLALSLVCETLAQNKTLKFDPESNPDIINLLVERFMDNVPSPLHREALEASSMLRNTTEALLAAVVDSKRAFELFEWLKTLTFIEVGPQGIYPHDLAREAISLELRWRNPDHLARLHDKARGYYADHLERTTGLVQQAILSDYIYLHRDNPSIKPFFNWNLSSSYVDAAKAGDHNEILQIVRKYEGRESEKIAATWLKSPAAHIQVLRNSLEVGITGFLLTIDASVATAEEIQADPGTRVCVEYLNARGPLRQGERALLYRYWMSRESYQDVCPDQSLLFVAIVFSSLTSTNLAYDFQVCANPDFFAPMFEYASLPRLREADFSVGDKGYGVFGHDWRSLPVKAWLALMSERELPATGAPAPSAKVEEIMVLSESGFAQAVVDALKNFHNAARLAENPLLKSRVVLDQAGVDSENKERIRALREAILGQAKTLAVSGRDVKLYQALESYYFKPARSQEAAAEMVDVSIASYRRHLKGGIQRVVDLLWQMETGG